MNEHITGEEGRVLGNLSCPCGCGKTIENSFLFILKSIAREIGDIRINSGARCEKHNEQVGGQKNSAHIFGLAVDVATPDSFTRYKVLRAIIMRDIKRLGWSKDKKFIHFDIAKGLVPHPDGVKEYPQFVAWDY